MRKTLFILFMALTAFALQSCEKDREPIYEGELVNQQFGLTIDVKESDMLKAWNPNLWVPEYSPLAYNLVFTGTGNSVGVNYTKSCTVAELKSPAGVNLPMLTGTYDVSFETIHQQATGYSANSFTVAQLTTPYNKTTGRYLDIKIAQNVVVTGSPVNLTATLQDCLVIVDIPQVNLASRQRNVNPESICSLLLNDKKVSDQFLYGYIDAQPLYIKLEFEAGLGIPDKVVDLTSAVNGKAYHLVSPFSAAVILTIPGLETEQIIVP